MSIETAIQIIRDVHASSEALNLKLRESQEKIEELERQLEDMKRDQTERDILHWMRMSKIHSSLDECNIPDFGSMPMKDFKEAITHLETSINSIKSTLSSSINDEIDKRQSSMGSSSQSSSSSPNFDDAFKIAMDSLGVNLDLIEDLFHNKNAVVFGDVVGRVVRGDPLASLRFVDLIANDYTVLESFTRYGYALSSFTSDEKTHDFGMLPDRWTMFRMVNCSGRVPIRVFVPPLTITTTMVKRVADLKILDFMNVIYDGKCVHFQKYANFLLKCHTSSNMKLPLHHISMGASVTEKNVNNGIRIPPATDFPSSKDIGEMRQVLTQHCDLLNPVVKTFEDALKKNIEDHGVDYSNIQKLLAVEGVYMCGGAVRHSLLGENFRSNSFYIVSLRGESVVRNLVPAAASSPKQIYDKTGARWVEMTYTSKWCNGMTILLTYPDRFSETDDSYKMRTSYFTLDNIESLIAFDFNHAFFDGEKITITKLECILERRHVSKPSDEMFLNKETVERMKGYGYTFDPAPTFITTTRVLKKDDPFDILLK